MYSIQEAREAQQMWAYKFGNAGREGITLNIGKPRSLVSALGSLMHNVFTKVAVNGESVRMTVRKGYATT